MTPRLKGLRFRPRKWGFLLALLASVGTISLGNWQTRRAQEKQDLAARVERAGREAPMAVPGKALGPADFAFKRLSAKGEFLPQFTILLDNKVHRRRPGYFVVTPGMKLGEAISAAGGYSQKARLEKVKITSPGAKKAREVNYKDIEQGYAGDIVLQAGDQISVPGAKKTNSMPIRFAAGVAAVWLLFGR